MARLVLLLMLLVTAAPLVPRDAAAQTSIVAVVNGKTVTSYDVAQRERLLRLTGNSGNLREQALEELITERIQLDAAESANVSVPASAIDDALVSISQRVKMNPSQLQQALGQAGVNIATLKDRLRAQIAFSRLVRARFSATLKVTEQDLVAALLADEDTANVMDTFEYNLEQVIVALPDNPSSSRLAAANSTAQSVRSKFRSCRDGLAMARQTRNVVVRPFGRRMEPELPSDVQDAVKSVSVGQLTPPIETPLGLVMFAVCDKKEIRSTNAAMKSMEEDITNERGEAFTKQYLRQLRRDAVIERR